MNAVNPEDYFEEITAGLDRFEHMPDDVLWEIVARDGTCAWLYQHDLEPEWTGDELTDRELAARICANCRVRQECLELELRASGDETLGVWGALPAEDVRAVFPVWLVRRRRRGGERGGRL
jgi:WhiB family transcriptional regulator, redox-sensing transcriptional regulator